MTRLLISVFVSATILMFNLNISASDDVIEDPAPSGTVLTEGQKADIKAVVDYLWEDEHKHFQKEHYPQNHIYRILKRLKSSYE